MKYTTLVVLVLATIAWSQSKPKLAEAYVSPDYVAVDGVWEPDNPTKQNELSYSVLRIQCYRHGGQEFVGSDAFCVAADATPIPGTGPSPISISIAWLKVIQWNNTQIIAVDDSPVCLTAQTIIDMASKTVSALDIRKPSEKGYNNLCDKIPDRQTYYLRERVDYMLNHKPVKK